MARNGRSKRRSSKVDVVGEIDLWSRAQSGETIVIEVKPKKQASRRFVNGLKDLGADERLVGSALGKAQK